MTTLGAGEIRVQEWIDDKTLLFNASTPDRGMDAFTVGADSGSTPVAFLRSPFNEEAPNISPDRKVVVFLSNEGNGNQLWMRDFPVPRGKWNISPAGSQAPRCSPDGKYVYFWRSGSPNDTLFRTRIERTPAVVVQAPEVVVVMDAAGTENWDLNPDGRRFIVAVPGGAEAPTAATARPARYLILQNWFGELRRLMGARSKS